MKFSEKLKDLKGKRADRPQKILSLYLNTDPSNMNQQGGEWKIKLKNGLKKFEEYIDEMGRQDELKGYRELKDRVHKTITGRERELKKSVVLFATPDKRLWIIEDLQVPVETSFHWEEYPVLDQLEDIQSKYPYSGIIVINKEDATVLETEMGVLVNEFHYSFDPDIEDWREHQDRLPLPLLVPKRIKRMNSKNGSKRINNGGSKTSAQRFPKKQRKTAGKKPI
nr:VLRF1 family aeRF1-type release factor [Pseudalkalibacillus decolorationis]